MPPGEQAPCRRPPTPATGWVFGKMKAMVTQGGNTNSHMQVAPKVADEAALAMLKERRLA